MSSQGVGVRHVHFIAICGTGMGSLAGLLKSRGLTVTGSDSGLYPPMSDALESWGIPVVQGFDPENLKSGSPDLVVIGNAVRPDNPEAQAAIDAGLPVRSFPDALRELAIEGKYSVVVAGTHGKTTTTSLLATLLQETGQSPSFLVGGLPHNFPGGFQESDGAHFIVEGDEYDTVFFDKTPKFLHYGARTAILTSVEFDHADIYRDLDHVKQAFRSFVVSLPGDGALVADFDHREVRDVASHATCPVVRYGLDGGTDLDWCARDLRSDEEGTSFEVQGPDGEQHRTRILMHGTHNVSNALAALVTCKVLGVPFAAAAAALPAYRGVKRRQEVRGEEDGVVVVDDFAHHPTAVAGSIQALRDRYSDRRLIAVFEPRSNTSRRALFQRDYVRALSGADRIVVARVPDGALYSAFEEVKERLSADVLAADLEELGRCALALPDVDAIVEHLVRETSPGDVVLIMSNGGFDDIWEKLLEALRARA